MSLSEYCNLAFLRGNVSFENVSFEMCLLKCVFSIFYWKTHFKRKMSLLKCAFWIIFRKTHFKRDISLFDNFLSFEICLSKKNQTNRNVPFEKTHYKFPKGTFPRKKAKCWKDTFQSSKREMCLLKGTFAFSEVKIPHGDV